MKMIGLICGRADCIRRLKGKGAKGVILGCTKIGLLINAECSPLPVFDTTLIHAEKAALYSIGGESK